LRKVANDASRGRQRTPPGEWAQVFERRMTNYRRLWDGARLGQGLLTGRVRKSQPSPLRRAGLFRHLNDERRVDAVEALIPLAQAAGLPMTPFAMAFAIAHPGVTSALLGPRTMEQLDDLLASTLRASTGPTLWPSWNRLPACNRSSPMLSWSGVQRPRFGPGIGSHWPMTTWWPTWLTASTWYWRQLRPPTAG
jgi:hypothetical protein